MDAASSATEEDRHQHKIPPAINCVLPSSKASPSPFRFLGKLVKKEVSGNTVIKF
jgi:hypothetical protein